MCFSKGLTLDKLTTNIWLPESLAGSPTRGADFHTIEPKPALLSGNRKQPQEGILPIGNCVSKLQRHSYMPDPHDPIGKKAIASQG